jgi:hypothetical protein
MRFNTQVMSAMTASTVAKPSTIFSTPPDGEITAGSAAHEAQGNANSVKKICC